MHSTRKNACKMHFGASLAHLRDLWGVSGPEDALALRSMHIDTWEHPVGEPLPSVALSLLAFLEQPLKGLDPGSQQLNEFLLETPGSGN